MQPDTLGWAAAALMVATFSCREARHLRPLAVATNLAFVGYGAAAGLMPVLALHLLLLPINLWRWAQAVALSRRDVRQAAEQFGRLLCVVALSAVPLVTGCGGGGGDEGSGATPPSPPPSGNTPATIGQAGGAVRHASGAEVVVPAGALAAPAAVEITATSAGAPAWPSDVAAFGEVYAFTPHGTRFAAPVTVRVPFDATRVPAGETPVLYKADTSGPAAGLWRPLEDAVVEGATMRASVDTFSHLTVAPPALKLTGLEREWVFHLWMPGLNVIEAHRSRAGWTAVESMLHLSGPLTGALIKGNATGSQYEAHAVSPDRALRDPNPIGVIATLNQTQIFLKEAEGATLQFTISSANAAAWDYDLRPLECLGRPICLRQYASVEIGVTATVIETGRSFFYRHGIAYLDHDAAGAWKPMVTGAGETSIWQPRDFEVIREDAYTASLRLARVLPTDIWGKDIVVDVPLADVLVGQRIRLHAHVVVMARDHRQTESKAQAFLRDPQRLGSGVGTRTTGLRPVGADVANEPLPLPAPPAACANADPAAGTLQFASAKFETEEGRGPGNWLVVTRSGGTRGRVGATVAVRGGTAGSDDFDAFTGYVGFADGEDGERVVLLPVRPDGLAEADETIELELTDPRGCVALGAQARTTLVIRDDDRPPPPPAAYRVGGTVTGLAGRNFVLEDRAQAIELLVAADGSFEFNRNYGSGAAYDVRVKSPPVDPAQVCTVLRGSGTVAAVSVADIEVRCTTPLLTGELDPGFGTLGKVAEGLPGGAIAIGRQSTGHIVAVNGTRLVRYDADGKLDRTFGGGRGIVDSLLVGASAEVSGMSIGPDDRIVVAGRILQPGLAPPNYQMAAARFMPDGTRDTSFGSSGQATFRLAGIAESAARVVVQPDGRVLLLGQMTLGTGLAANNNIALVRLLVDGTLDGSFGTSGAVMFDATKRDFPQAALLQPDGRVVIGGKVAVNDSEPSDSFFGRVDALGAPEAGFGRTPSYSTISDEVVDLALQPDGRIVLLVAARGVNWEIALARINADGSPDTGFGTQGLVRRDVGPHDDWPRAVAVQTDGRIVVAAQVSNPPPMAPSFALLRFEASGAPDLAFGSDGVLRVPFFGGTDNANDLLVQPDGRIVAAGSARSGLTADIAMVRLNP